MNTHLLQHIFGDSIGKYFGRAINNQDISQKSSGTNNNIIVYIKKWTPDLAQTRHACSVPLSKVHLFRSENEKAPRFYRHQTSLGKTFSCLLLSDWLSHDS